MKTSCIVVAAFLGVAFHPGIAAPITVEIDTDRTKLLNTERNCVVQVQLKGGEAPSSKKRLPLNVSLVLDRSGSMGGAKMERAKQAAAAAIDQLDREDTVSVVIYDDEVEVLVPPQKVTDPEAIKSRIYGVSVGGSTALHGGVEEGAKQIRSRMEGDRLHRIILLSDGLANVGPSSPGDLSKLGRALRKEDIAVTTIGLGDDYNEDLMTALAEASHANYYYVQDPEKLPGIFAEELRAAKSVVARGLKIKITLPEGVKAIEVLGEPDLKFKNNTLEIDLAEFYARQQRRFLIACEAPEGEKSQSIARVTVEAVDFEGVSVKLTGEAKVERTTDSDAAEKSVNRDVAAGVAITRNRLAKAEAVALADEGKADEAVQVLRRQAITNTASASALPAEAGAALAVENEALEATARELEQKRSLESSSRKRIQYENYQDKMNKR